MVQTFKFKCKFKFNGETGSGPPGRVPVSWRSRTLNSCTTTGSSNDCGCITYGYCANGIVGARESNVVHSYVSTDSIDDKEKGRD